MEYEKKNIRKESLINNELNDTKNILLYKDSDDNIFQDWENTQNTSDSTMLSSIIHSKLNSINEVHETKNTENKFNSVRSNFYNKYNLYDILLYPGPKFKNIPPKYMINENKYGFLLNTNL